MNFWVNFHVLFSTAIQRVFEQWVVTKNYLCAQYNAVWGAHLKIYQIIRDCIQTLHCIIFWWIVLHLVSLLCGIYISQPSDLVYHANMVVKLIHANAMTFGCAHHQTAQEVYGTCARCFPSVGLVISFMSSLKKTAKRCESHKSGHCLLIVWGATEFFWLVVYLPLWKIMEFVSDDDIPKTNGKS